MEIRRKQMHKADRQPAECRNRLGRYRGNACVRVETIVVAAHATIQFRWILGRNQIVGHGDGRQQYQNDDRERNQLRSALPYGTRRNSEPSAQHRKREQYPAEIECQLHPTRQFYMRHELPTEVTMIDKFDAIL